MSKILVVDDEPTIVELIEESLRMDGFETTRAYSGEEALEALGKDPPDLVLLDLMLPGMDGYEVCRQMQKDVRLSQIPVIMLTAKSAVADKVAGYQKGADDYITKPFDAEELLVRVRAQLHHLYHETTNELTGLPGSAAVENAIDRRTAVPSEPWSIIYIDIENFTVYNEVYSYLEGDEMIKMAAAAIREAVEGHGSATDFVGHMGGDNFVVVSVPERTPAICQAASERFDALVAEFYSPTDRNQGYVVSINHEGSLVQTPVARLSYDIVDNDPQSEVARATDIPAVH
ncbi:MAG TPA: response regulator [Chloroflexia bacterium]|nr:response regulator [Chloroflexia bacterium]